VSVVEIAPANGDWDTPVLARPSYSAPLVGHAMRGARVAVRGEVVLDGHGNGCSTRLYYALEPAGYLCSSEAHPTQSGPTNEPVNKLVGDTPLPYRYAMVLVTEGEFLPMWRSLADLREHAEPERQLSRGDTVALADPPHVEHVDGESYYVSVDEKVLPVKKTTIVQHFSRWQGEPITPTTHLPFGWVSLVKANVYAAPGGAKVDTAPSRTRVDILEEQTVGHTRWLRIGDDRWVKEQSINEVRKIERPAGTGTHRQWFDVDLGEQIVVAYENDQPVYATLTASGHEPNHTPRGNYPIWGKGTSVTMKSQEYDDLPYYVNRVPWVMFFQAHNALHGAYWHDQFGHTKSHGCVNLAPNDARYLFDWLEPKLPMGWTSVRYYDLTQAPVAHIHDTHKRKDIVQERNIGPPDKRDEAERIAKATERREAEAAAAAAAAAQSGDPSATTPAAGPTGTVLPPAAPPAATTPSTTTGSLVRPQPTAAVTTGATGAMAR
jgi:lipoprotein-anchoring transpeptidase ErfK/SrfK